jgi:uncharacterized protein (UPF0548 family)
LLDREKHSPGAIEKISHNLWLFANLAHGTGPAGERQNELVQPPLNYDVVGATRPAEPDWSTRRQNGYRDFERTVRLGEGDDYWATASSILLRWGVKTRSGFTVDPQPNAAVQVGERYRLTAHLGLLQVREPVQVVAVVDEPDRRGFAYGTAHGHPVSGEEAFVLHRGPDHSVHLTLRSLTRAPQGRWRLVFPGALLLQPVYRRRYARALRPLVSGPRAG